MAKRATPKGKILARHMSGTNIRYAVHVTEGKDTLRVALIEVDPTKVRQTEKNTVVNADDAAIERALSPRFGVAGTTLLFSIHEGDVLTGLNEPFSANNWSAGGV